MSDLTKRDLPDLSSAERGKPSYFSEVIPTDFEVPFKKPEEPIGDSAELDGYVDSKFAEIKAYTDFIINKFEELLVSHGWADAKAAYKVMLGVLREALNNAIYHGNFGVRVTEDGQNLLDLGKQAVKLKLISDSNLSKEQRERMPSKAVEVFVEVSDNDILIEIKDSGEGFDWKNSTDPTDEEHILGLKNRGVFLMKQVFKATFNDKGNEVKLEKTKGA